jgi:hypothetical protein
MNCETENVTIKESNEKDICCLSGCQINRNEYYLRIFDKYDISLKIAKDMISFADYNKEMCNLYKNWSPSDMYNSIIRKKSSPDTNCIYCNSSSHKDENIIGFSVIVSNDCSNVSVWMHESCFSKFVQELEEIIDNYNSNIVEVYESNYFKKYDKQKSCSCCSDESSGVKLYINDSITICVDCFYSLNSSDINSALSSLGFMDDKDVKFEFCIVCNEDLKKKDEFLHNGDCGVHKDCFRKVLNSDVERKDIKNYIVTESLSD